LIPRPRSAPARTQERTALEALASAPWEEHGNPGVANHYWRPTTLTGRRHNLGFGVTTDRLKSELLRDNSVPRFRA
jgi:hypothetical protein